MMKDCYKRAKLDPRDTHYFEAHGTGTPTGDLIEAGAMGSMFKHGRTVNQPLLIGSAKTNIGHTETTSGLAGIIKVILSMENNIIPPSINFKSLNKKIPFEEWRLKLVTEPTPWPVRAGEPKRASINNFGYGGSNAHVIIESADAWRLEDVPATPAKEGESSVGLFILSAKSEKACKSMVANLKTYLDTYQGTSEPQDLLESIVYTLGQRRSLMPWVAAQPTSLTNGLSDVIKALDNPMQFKPSRTSRKTRLAFAFTGQGAQWYAMGRELISGYPSFRASIKAAEMHLKKLGAEWSLYEELHRDDKTSKVTDTEIGIPVCVAVQIALVDLLKSWGIAPSAVTAHSSGEISAAYTVGALDLRSAMAVAYHRAHLTAVHNATQASSGGMIAVGVGVDETEEYLAKLTCGGKAVAACINSPTSVTVAGDVNAVEEIEAMMKADGVFARRLRVDAAYHSHHMDPIADGYGAALAEEGLTGPVQGELTAIAFSSGVTGDRILDTEQLTDPEHWVASMVQPVQFVDAFTDMVMGDFDASGSSIDSIVEIGPHTALGSAMKDILGLPSFDGLQLPYAGTLARKTDARQSMLALAGALLCQGHPVKVDAINFPGGVPAYVNVATDLPSYPWVHETRHWQENRLNRAFRERSQPPHDLLGAVATWSNPSAPMWRNILKLNENAWLRDHVVENTVIYPGAGFMCLAMEAMVQNAALQGDETPIIGFHLREVDLQAALIVPDHVDGVELQTILTPADDKTIAYKGYMKFEIVSVTSEGDWKQHAQGMISAERGSAPVKSTQTLSGRTKSHETEEFYASLRRVGIKHGVLFQNIKSIEHAKESSQSVSAISMTGEDKTNSLPANCVISPALLDTIVQAAYTALPQAGSQMQSALVPRSVQSMWVSAQSPQVHLSALTTLGHSDSQTFKTNITVTDSESGTVAVQLDSLAFQSLGQGAGPIASAAPWETDFCTYQDWVPDPSMTSPQTLQVMRKQMAHPPDQEELSKVEDLRRVSVYYAMDLLAQLPASAVPDLEWFFKKFYAWAQDIINDADAGKLAPGSKTWTFDTPTERAAQIEKVRAASVNGEMVCQLGPHLAEMLRGEIAPLELMMEEALLTKYYRNILKWHRSFEDAASLLRNVVRQNPQARILEIGGGTGGGTHYMLDVIGNSSTGGPLASEYHFTDISSGFFEAARKEFAPWDDIMKYSKVDIEQDPIAQGLEYGSYDVIVACQVLHATQSMRKTMANVRKLLKPGGKLLLVETTQDQLDVQFVFGLVPGWWLSKWNEGRKTCRHYASMSCQLSSSPWSA
jgi:acyl transferase domain-containing protein/ubiquinone/menaquinone biosynthesis C-methylase UbiE